jgi:hypothetical protein
MDEDEKEMLSEARARLANTRSVCKDLYGVPYSRLSFMRPSHLLERHRAFLLLHVTLSLL